MRQQNDVFLMRARLQLGEEVTFIALLVSVLMASSVAPVSVKNVYAVYIHPSSGQTKENWLRLAAQSGINTVFVDIYYPTGIGRGTFLAEKKAEWIGRSAEPEFANIFSLDQMVESARKLHISVHVTISCFGELPAISPTSEEHRTHLREVVEYVVTNFPSVDGIHLDYVRYMSEWGLNAIGNTGPITTFVSSIQQIVQAKTLSAAVIAVGDQEEFNITRYQTGQDCREISEYLDFMCPMAYHLSHEKRLEWVGSVSQFMSDISKKPCKIYPTVQAYYQFETETVVLPETATNSPMPGPTFYVPIVGVLQLTITWRNPESRFLLNVRDSLCRKISLDQTVSHLRHSTGESWVLNANITGTWSIELKTRSLPKNGDVVTTHVSDLNEELPGYQALHSAILLAMTESDGFCVYALNNLSPEELSAIKDAIELGYRATANNHDDSNISELSGHFEQQTVAWQHSADHVFASQARASPADPKSQNPRVLSFRHASV